MLLYAHMKVSVKEGLLLILFLTSSPRTLRVMPYASDVPFPLLLPRLSSHIQYLSQSPAAGSVGLT